jgi:hypothetical protein
MYVVVQHQIKDRETAFARGEKLMRSEGAPPEVRVVQFYPSEDGSAVTCLWEADSLRSVQQYVDSTLGDASENTCYPVDSGHAFADRPDGIAASPAPAVA